MSNFDLGPVRGLRPDERDDAPVVSLGEMWGKTWEDTRKAQNFNSHLLNYSNAFDGIADRVKAATGEALDNPFRSATAGQSVEMLGTFSREAVEGSSLYAQWRQRVQELKAKHADKLDWDSLADEPGRVAWDSMKKAREEADALSERIGMVAPRDVPLVGGVPVLNAIGALGANLVRHPQYTATQLAAGFAGQMTSPADAAVNLLSFGAGGAAKSIIKNATRNALANAAGQALLSAPKQLSYQSAGLPYGAQVWADEVGAAAGAGFMLDAGIRTPARAAIRRFGMDTPAGTTLSRNTERGGILFDAIEDATPKPTARLEIDPETMRKAEAGDIAASREILEKTGAMEDPAVKYAVEHMEAGGRLTDDVLNLLEKELGVARPDGMKTLAAAMQGRYLDTLPEPVRQAPEPLLHERGAAVLDRVEAVSGAVEQLPPQIRQAVQDGLDAGIPRIVQAVEQAIEGPPEGVAARIMERVAPLLDERTLAEARLHSGRAGPVELAQAIRQFPDLIDSNVDLDARHVAMARSIAGMDDAAYADVARGTIPPEIAALVADRVPKESQARVLDDLQKAQPGSIAEAADLIEAIAPPRQVSGTEGQLASGSRIDDPAGAEAKAQTETLRQEAGQALDDAMEPIQRRDAIEDEIKKLRGQLIKGKREDAPQKTEGGEGEASGPGDIRRQLEALEREHALLQAKIMPGPDGYELARLATRAIDLRREADITAAVNDALRFGEQITPEGTRIDVRPDETMVSRAANGTVAPLDATSDMATGHIQLAVSAMDPSAKIGHEAVHTLVTLGHLSPTEVDALAALAREAGTFTKEAEYRKIYDGRDGLERILSEEAAASYIEARIRGDVKGPANTVVERIRQLIERIRSALARQGFQSREDVVQAIMSGEAAKREARADWRRDSASGEQLFAIGDDRRIPSLLDRLDAVGGDAKTLPQVEGDLGFSPDREASGQSVGRSSVEQIAQTFSPEARRFLESHPPQRLAAMIDMLGKDGNARERAAAAELKPRMDDVKAYIAASRDLESSLSFKASNERAARLAKAAAEPRPIDQAAHVYHGTTETFDQYSGEAARARSAAAQDAGIDVVWVTPQKTFAERFGSPRSLTLEPGFYFDPMADTDLARLAPFINAQPNAARLWDQLEGTDGKSTWGFLENADTLKELQRLGYDGVKMQEQWMDAGDRAKTAPTIAVFSRGKLFDTDRANMMFALRDWLPNSRQRRPLGAYRDADVITSDELPGRFTWKTPPKQGKVQMFHATNRAFDRFDPSKSQDFGIHFGTQKQAWTRVLNTDRIEGSRVIPANVEFNNAITLTDPGFWGPMEMMRLLRDKGVKFSKDEEDYFLQLAADIDRAAEIGPVAKGALRWIVNEAKDAIRDKLDEAGIDAIWYRNMAEGTGWSLAVWNEGQVRNTITGDLLYAMADAPPIKSDMAFVDRMNRMGELIAACRG